MMKILKIKPSHEPETLEVEVEGYPHASPVFPSTITEKEIKSALEAWKLNQDRVDAINLAARSAPKPPAPVVKKELTDLIGKELSAIVEPK